MLRGATLTAGVAAAVLLAGACAGDGTARCERTDPADGPFCSSGGASGDGGAATCPRMFVALPGSLAGCRHPAGAMASDGRHVLTALAGVTLPVATHAAS